MAFALPAEKQLTLAQACRFIKRALLPDSNNFKLFNQIVMLAEQAIEEGKAPEGKTRLEAYGTEHYSESHHAI